MHAPTLRERLNSDILFSVLDTAKTNIVVPVGRIVPVAIGIAVKNKCSLEQWCEDIAQGMVNNAIAIWGGGDHALLGLENDKLAITAGPIGFILLELGQFIFQIDVEARNVLLKPFAPQRLFGCGQQISKRADTRIQTCVSFHFRRERFLIQLPKVPPSSLIFLDITPYFSLLINFKSWLRRTQ